MKEIEDKIHEEIKSLSQSGDTLAEEGKYDEALTEYWNAFNLIPEPKNEWKATTWVLAAIGDANFLGKDYEAGIDNLSNAMYCPDAIGNPFLHLRLGQCLFEMEFLDQAADELIRAYALEGEELFSEDDPKYLHFLRTRIESSK